MTSVVRLVKPHAMRSLWPMMTPGTPEKPNPATSNGHSVEITRHFRPIWCHTLGSDAPRCGSFASSGSPLSVSAPETTQEFEPIPSPTSPTRALTASMTPSTCDHSTDADAPVSEAPDVSAFSAPSTNEVGVTAGTLEISGTITGFRSKG